MRAFFRQFAPGEAPASYYDYVAGRTGQPWTDATEAQWVAAGEEARQLTLGVPDHDAFLRERIRPVAQRDQPWVLIGGPPCQAYSLVGRSRNLGKAGYKAEEDHRHFLYTHYLKILKEFRPAAFVMENVKGILSSKVGGELMFPRILEDLHQPGGRNGPRYQIVPLVISNHDSDKDVAGKRFILRAEELGVPQARHRVVLLGLIEGIDPAKGKRLVPLSERFGVSDVIDGLPKLRSGVTDREVGSWCEFAEYVLEKARDASNDEAVAAKLEKFAASVKKRDPGMGGRWIKGATDGDRVPDHLRSWLIDPRLDGVLNHEVREHMASDLKRYAFASAFARVHGHSPRGAKEFPSALYPKHKNWKSGKFVDRFKVQLSGAPSSTVTSHLCKDGHYFIHHDPSQLRSLSVREAARLQTFPDNYFFEGSRGAQFKQVGNAVPPWMARQIAGVVHSYLKP
ncbi:DNA cytosine methyltransferase [Lysobacter niastensis]|uniref:DNA cytosine methyltransferase n=1 Tax=Lysobacter niastensis TaxID=380629 RepID=UPI001E30E585|nr:DNA (cytosine-5-)-methyltransferase [Lysobacter niastensis]